MRGRLLEIVGGFRALVRYPNAGLIVGLFLTQVAVRGALTVLLVSTAIELLGIGEAGVGSGLGNRGGGSSARSSRWPGWRRQPGPGVILSLAKWGAPIRAMGIIQKVMAFAMAAVIGAANASIDVAGYTIPARACPNEVRGRVFGVLQSLVGIGVAVGALAAPLLVELFGLQAALIVTGLVLPLCALLGYRGVRRAEAEAIVPGAGARASCADP